MRRSRGCQLVDLGAHGRVNRLGELGQGPGAPGEARDLLHEERVPLGALDDGGDLVGSKGIGLRGGVDELLDDLGWQGPHDHADTGLGREPARLPASYDENRPRPS